MEADGVVRVAVIQHRLVADVPCCLAMLRPVGRVWLDGHAQGLGYVAGNAVGSAAVAVYDRGDALGLSLA